MADYLGAHNPYTPKIEGRITEVGAGAQPAEAAKPAQTAQTGSGVAPADATPEVPAPPAASNDIANTPPAVEAPTAKPAAAPAAEAGKGETEKPVGAGAAVQAGGTHIIVQGDTFWDIAVKAYGDGTKWRRIARANPGQEPHRLLVGSELKIPAK